jgi:hypothetical protein
VSEPSHLWAVSSGWDGPFQLEEVVVAARGADNALRRAEAAFAEARQPVCRAKMRIADLGPLDEELVLGPRRAGGSLSADGEPVELRCGVELPG